MTAPDGHATTSELRAALREANMPSLLMALAQLTGEEHWFSPRYRPSRPKGFDDNDSAGLPDDVQQEIRDAALEAVLRFRAGQLTPVELAPEQVARMLGVALGEEVPESYGSLLAEELGVTDRSATKPPEAIPSEFRVLIVGAGFSGLCTAIMLRNAGIPYTIIEKNHSVGGTWLENTYPGCGVDTPCHLYSFSFAPNSEWDRYFAKRDQIYDYVERLADEYEVREHVRLRTEVSTAVYRPEEALWEVTVTGPGGDVEVLTATALVCGAGVLSRPSIPELPGAQTFSGPAMHTAQWRSDVSLDGKRVAVIGTGASAMQLVPTIADVADRVIVFERSKQWILPHPSYQRAVSPAVRTLLDEVPFYGAWYRLRLFWNWSDRLHPSLRIDPEWPDQHRSVNAINDGHREFLTRYLNQQLAGRPDLIEACLPDYPPYGKRPLIDNGWFRTVQRDDVDLVHEAVAEITPDGLVTASGAKHEADVIVYATGFKALQYLSPMEIIGRSGRSLRDSWGPDDARAYLGTTVPDFPNLFIVNGPNTTAGHGGSAIIGIELQARYVVSLLTRMITEELRAVEVREDVFEAYNTELDRELSCSVAAHSGMQTYYRNDAGRVVLLSPWSYLDFWGRTREPDLADFRTE